MIALVVETFRFISLFEGDIPGASKKECGNYLEHDLCAAKSEAGRMVDILTGWTESKLKYVSE